MSTDKKYLRYDDFLTTYSLDKEDIKKNSKQGAYGTVYYTGNHIVKSSGDISSFVRELSILNSIDHPNIIKIENWSHVNNRYFFAQKRGISFDIYKNNIEFSELKNILVKLISALKYLHANGIAHLDVKPENIVFIDDEPMLIDFGISTYGYQYNNGLFVKSDAAFTLNFRDPEYSNLFYNSAEDSDFYALAVTMYKFMFKFFNTKSDLFICDKDIEGNLLSLVKDTVFETDFETDDFTYIYNFIVWYTSPSSKRNDISGLVKPELPEIVVDNGLKFDNTVYNNGHECGSSYQIISDYLTKQMSKLNVTARSAFLTYHNIHRMFWLKNPNISNYSLSDENGYEASRELNRLSFAMLYLSQSIFFSNIIKTKNDMDFFIKNTNFTPQNITELCTDILELFDGNVFQLTLWDYSNNFGDLTQSFIYTLSCDYSKDYYPDYNTGQKSDKNVSFNRLLFTMQNVGFDVGYNVKEFNSNGNIINKYNGDMFDYYKIKTTDKFKPTNDESSSVDVVESISYDKNYALNTVSLSDIKNNFESLITKTELSLNNPNKVTWVELIFEIVAFKKRVKSSNIYETIFSENKDRLNRIIRTCTDKKDKRDNLNIINLFDKYDIDIKYFLE